MEMTIQELRHKAARGENLTAGELLEIVAHMEQLEKDLEHTRSRLEQKSTQVSLMRAVNHLALESAASGRTIADMREEVLTPGTKRDTCLYNSFEVRQCIYALDHAEERYADLKAAYEKIDVENLPTRSVKQVMDVINNNVIGPFSFKEVHAWTEYLRGNAGQNRPMRNNVREVFQLLKAQPNALFYAREVEMVREWGTSHDRNLSIVKMRLGRAFTDPVGYMDKRFDMMLTKDTKRQMLDGRVLSAQAYQDAVFARPDFLRVKHDWKLYDGKTQFHAGEHFHTRATDGMWWCGTQFNDLTGHDLMRILETALGELRLLYIHFPNGVTNEATQ